MSIFLSLNLQTARCLLHIVNFSVLDFLIPKQRECHFVAAAENTEISHHSGTNRIYTLFRDIETWLILSMLYQSSNDMKKMFYKF